MPEGACQHPVSLLVAPLVAALAQLVEHIIRNDGVTGSSPVSGTIQRIEIKRFFGAFAVPGRSIVALARIGAQHRTTIN